jgi:hypothetical protein
LTIDLPVGACEAGVVDAVDLLDIPIAICSNYVASRVLKDGASWQKHLVVSDVQAGDLYSQIGESPTSQSSQNPGE